MFPCSCSQRVVPVVISPPSPVFPYLERESEIITITTVTKNTHCNHTIPHVQKFEGLTRCQVVEASGSLTSLPEESSSLAAWRGRGLLPGKPPQRVCDEVLS